MNIQFVRVTADAGELRLSGDDRPNKEVIDLLKVAKPWLLEAGDTVAVFELNSLARALSTLLRSDISYLLANGYISKQDLIEQADSDPQAIAALIRSNPDWSPQAAGSKRSESAQKAAIEAWKVKAVVEAKQRIASACTASPQWLLARGAHHQHWTTCLACYPPNNRYCATGAALKARYDAITEQEGAA